MKKKLEYRMYGIVPFNISEIQKGIQFGHAVVEYAQAHFKDVDYQKWAKHDKTFIILNGGTTHNGPMPNDLGTMQLHRFELLKNDVKSAKFYEPDLNDALTAIVFLVDERVYDKEKYPDPDKMSDKFKNSKPKWRITEYCTNFTDEIGGKKNLFLREFLSKFRLA